MAASITLCCLLLVAALSEPPRVSFLRTPSVVTDQWKVPIQVRVPIHEENRTLAVAAWDGDFRAHYTERDLHSERRKTVWRFDWQLPAGELVIVAVVWDDTHEVARATHPIAVVGF